jgi:hypothetical protein
MLAQPHSSDTSEAVWAGGVQGVPLLQLQLLLQQSDAKETAVRNQVLSAEQSIMPCNTGSGRV